MKIVIIGAGEVGTHIASHLIEEKKDVTIIERDPEIARRVNDMLDCLVINGEGTNVDCLVSAGVDKADIFVAATSIDEVNMISCLVAASEFKIPVKIARVRNIEYNKTNIFDKSFIGVDYIVNPEIEASYDIAQTVELGATSSIFSFDGTNAQLRDFILDENSIMANKQIKEIRTLFKEQFVISGVMRDGEVFIPDGNFEVSVGDHIYITALGRSFEKIMAGLGKKAPKLNKIIIVGGGLIGKHVAGMLIDKGREVRLIEKDYDKCKEIAALYPDILVIHGDVSDEEIFEQENLSLADAVITTTQNEELNILAGVYAKSQGVSRAVALIDKTNYTYLATSLGIDACVSPKTSSSDAILKFIRRGNVKKVYTIFEGQAEAIELHIAHDSFLAKKKLKDIKLPAGCLIVAVQRRRKTIIPDGNFEINIGDSIIVFIIHSSISKLEELLEI